MGQKYLILFCIKAKLLSVSLIESIDLISLRIKAVLFDLPKDLKLNFSLN